MVALPPPEPCAPQAFPRPRAAVPSGFFEAGMSVACSRPPSCLGSTGTPAASSPVVSTSVELRPCAPAWLWQVFLLVAIYKQEWRRRALLRPAEWFGLAGLVPPAYPPLRQCVGMIVRGYKVGYPLAVADPYRHWLTARSTRGRRTL